MFEGVMKQNGVQYERWPLALRTAVTGSKLEDIAALDADKTRDFSRIR